jgi:hypothetical protein
MQRNMLSAVRAVSVESTCACRAKKSERRIQVNVQGVECSRELSACIEKNTCAQDKR